MKKEEQRKVNDLCLQAFCEYVGEQTGQKLVGRLRTCTATVFESDNYYVLWSYNTMVALIDKRTDTLFDVLRYVYDYTATSAQHIAKFSQDYGQGVWGCETEYRYYEL